MSQNLKEQIGRAAIAFRGYNVTNLGRTKELLEHAAYGPVVRRCLQEASVIAADVVGKRVDLVGRVKRGRETTLRTYHEAIALIIAMELAQLELLEQFHGVDWRQARVTMGYSLGELSAVAASGIFEPAHVYAIPLNMAQDCAELAKDVTLGVIFSQGTALQVDDVERLCLRINSEREGVVAISSILSPNSLLILGQRRTVHRFKELMSESLEAGVHLRRNPHRWPPLHTSIVWQRHIPNRAALMMQDSPGGLTQPTPPILSLVTGKASYNDHNARALLHQWADHPQRLWDVVYECLSMGIETVIHVGPQPNLIPATFKRLSDNVKTQASGRSLGSLGLRAVSRIVQRPWLAALLPSRTALLRAPGVNHVNLEDWLLSNDE